MMMTMVYIVMNMIIVAVILVKVQHDDNGFHNESNWSFCHDHVDTSSAANENCIDTVSTVAGEPIGDDESDGHDNDEIYIYTHTHI